MKNQKPALAALAYAFLVGLSFLITKWVVPYAPPTLILAHRFTIAFLTYSFFLILTKQSIHLTLKKIASILPATFFYPLLFFSLQLYGLTKATSAEAGMIFAAVPIITVFIEVLLGKRPSLIQIICAFISVSGVFLIISQNLTSSTNSIMGPVLLFLSAVSFVLYTIVLKRILVKVTIHELTIVLISIGFIIFNLMFFIPLAQSESIIAIYLKPFYQSGYSLGIIYLGLFASVLASLFSNYSLKYLSAPQFSVFTNLSTLISIAAGAIQLKENLYAYHFTGGALILFGVIGTNFANQIQRYMIKKK